ncbi:MAG: hypothetical protein ACI35S_07375 [Anaeroplasma sp.]
METIVIIDRTYNGKSKMNEKIYNVILNMIMEYLLNNPLEVYNEIDVSRNVMKEVEDEK